MSPALLPVRFARALTLTAALAGAVTALRAADEIASGDSGVPRSTAYSLHEWHEADGLPHDEVARVLQDQRGFLWVATAEGLARFDSVHFDNFAASLRAAGASASVRTLAETAGLGLVCAPVDGGLYGLRGETWQSLPVPRDVPVNALHAQGYPSLGCAPCTRAVQPGEDERAGRWWWETADKKECGLHVPPEAAAQARWKFGGIT